MKISKEELFRKEPITEKEFRKIAQFIDQTYPARTNNDIPFLADKSTFDVWYRLLNNRNYLAMRLGMEDYCLENKYAPALSDIAEYTGKKTIKVAETRRVLIDNLNEIKWKCGIEEIGEEETNNYLDLILEKEERNLDEYIFTSNRFVSFASWEVNDNKVEAKSLQELIDLWKEYWKMRKNPS